MTELHWKTLRETRPTVEELLDLCAIASAPVDVERIASLIGIEIAAIPLHRLIDTLPADLVEVRLPEVDEGLVDGVVRFDSAKAVIFLNNASNIPPTRRRFTIATLLYHVLFHAPGAYARMQEGVATDEERDALDFASELLLPSSLLSKECDQHPDISDPEIAQLFNVSQAAVRVRFARLIDPAEEPWLALGLSPSLPLKEAEKIIEDRLEQHRPELFASLPPEYAEKAAQTRHALMYGRARLRLQYVLNLPGGIPSVANMPTAEEVGSILKEARKLITTRGWSPRFRATDGYGKKRVRFDRPNAGRFSPVGAIYRIAGDNHGARDIALAVFAQVAGVRSHPSEVDRWNEQARMTVEFILSTFDQAIRIVESSGQSE
jgi:Zn-dependent peptidase ImmA (M78 family)